MSASTYLSDYNIKNEVIKKIRDNDKKYIKAKKMAKVCYILSFLPMLIFMIFAFVVEGPSWVGLLVCLAGEILPLVIFLCLAHSLKYSAYTKCIEEFSGPYNMELQFKNDCFEYRYSVSSWYGKAPYLVVYSVAYEDIISIEKSEYQLFIKGKAITKVYKDPVKKYKLSDDKIEKFEDTEAISILLSFKENEEIIEKLNRIHEIEDANEHRTYFANYFIHKKAGIPTARKRVEFKIAEIVAIPLECIFAVISVVVFSYLLSLNSYEQYLYSDVLFTAFSISVLGFGLLFVIKKAIYKACAHHGKEDKERLVIDKDRITIIANSEDHEKRKLVYTIDKKEIRNVEEVDNELLIKGKGKITIYNCYDGRVVDTDTKKSEMNEDSVYGILLAYEENKEIKERIFKMAGEGKKERENSAIKNAEVQE